MSNIVHFYRFILYFILGLKYGIPINEIGLFTCIKQAKPPILTISLINCYHANNTLLYKSGLIEVISAESDFTIETNCIGVDLIPNLDLLQPNLNVYQKETTINLLVKAKSFMDNYLFDTAINSITMK